jgi:DNA-binding winged helix-turn-helix (wHTH) protein/Tol biopolymer transport system component
VDFSARELRRDGVKVKIQDRPFEILTILLERPSQIVSREEFRKRLWPSDTFVDFDHSLNTSINKLRQSLGDDVENPRFIATVGRHGYRFIAPANGAESPSAAGGAIFGISNPNNGGDAAHSGIWRSRATLFLFIGCLAVIVIAFVAMRRYVLQPLPRVVSITRISHELHLDPWGRFASDGARVFFSNREGDHWNLMQVPAAGGDAQPFPGPLRNMRISGVSPDRSQVLALAFSLRGPDLPVWLIPIVGGPPRRVGNVIADDAVFAPNGQRIYVDKADGIYSCDLDGSHLEKFVTLPGRSSYPRWDKEGRRLRFTMEDPQDGSTTIWEVAVSGSRLHKVLPNWPLAGHECCGEWTSDGRYFLYQSAINRVETIWALRESGSGLLSKPSQPSRLTFGLENYGHPIQTGEGSQVIAWGGNELRELYRYSTSSGRADPLFPSAQTADLAYSPDGLMVAYSVADTLWRSKPDGSGRQAVAAGFDQVSAISWSPDGKQILFCGGSYVGGTPKYFAASVDGGPPKEVNLGPGYNEPAWAPDGSIVFSRRGAGDKPDPASGIYLLNLQNSSFTKIPGSEGLVHVAWSPDQRYLAAVTAIEEVASPSRFELYDSRTQKWKVIAEGVLLNLGFWTSDSKAVYIQDILGPFEPVYRYAVDGKKPIEEVFNFAPLLHSGYIRAAFGGFLPDGSVIVLLTKGNADLYRLELDLP